MESAIVPRAARHIGTVSGVDSTRTTGILIAAYSARTAYSAHAARGRARRRASTAANASATSASCQKHAIGNHGDAGSGCPQRRAAFAAANTTIRPTLL